MPLRLFFYCLVSGGAFLFGGFLFIAYNRVVDFSVLEQYNAGKPTIILDDTGAEWARFQLDRRESVTFEKLPSHLVHAFVAAEDWAFFSHHGLSFKGILRSSFVNLYHGRIVQGASTITQQLVKLLFLNLKKSFKRKVKEQLCALLVEQQFTKEQIMQTYLNHVYFGCGIYGVQAASQRFWSKNVSELSIGESAVLAAIVRSPRNYCPILCPLSAENRRNVVLGMMNKLGYITSEQVAYEMEQPVVVSEYAAACAPHLRETIRQFLEDLVGKDQLYRGGLQVQTTINREIQEHASAAFCKQITALRQEWLPDVDGALISIDVKTGGIKALVGGFDFTVSKFNRALQAKRQMGSTFKPLVYAAAISKGKKFYDVAVDEPLELGSGANIWRPQNVYNTFDGAMTLAHALTYSNNIIAIKTFLDAGAQAVVALAERAHIPGPLQPYPSLALGCVDATPTTVAGMFNIFANGGAYVAPHYIKWVKDQWGTKIFKTTVAPESVLPSYISGQVSRVLSLSMGRARKGRWLPSDWIDGQAISKTGTSDFRTCWFVGSTPELTTAVYVGRDDNALMGKNVFPLRTAFPIWIGLYKEIPLARKQFLYDPSLHEVTIHEKTGKILNNATGPEAITILV